MPEPAPPGELCSGKLGEFSQALRADSIFGSKRRGGMQITTGDKRGEQQTKQWVQEGSSPPLHKLRC